MPFTEQNRTLLEEASSINFKLKKNGAINPFYHNSYERGLFFIKKAIEVHGNKYGYGKVEYVTIVLRLYFNVKSTKISSKSLTTILEVVGVRSALAGTFLLLKSLWQRLGSSIGISMTIAIPNTRVCTTCWRLFVQYTDYFTQLQ